MPTRETAPTGAPCWVDLMTSDAEGARAFYSALFGWTSTEPTEEFGGYFQFMRDGVPVAGGMPAMPDAGPPNIWSVYIATDDARKAAEVATTSGAQIIAAPMDVADLGTMVVLIDPTGAAIGMWQANTFQGTGVLEEPGSPAWFELFTRDYEGALGFYKAVFGWDTKVVGDSDDFRYTSAISGETSLCGVMDAAGFLPEGVPSHWSVYFAVDNCDATLAKLVENMVA